MSDQAPQPSLAERALSRLRKIATGNGLEPAAIEVLEIQEDNFILKGEMKLSLLCETESASYPGQPRGKDVKKVGSFSSLQSAVADYQRDFRRNPDWIDAALQEIKTHEKEGWGLNGAKVILPEASALYAASETCASCSGRKSLVCDQCQGKGDVICNQCQGQGRELCYYCMGRGEDPQQHDRPCPTCNGTRYATCRFCQMRGHLPCPTCHGSKGTPCRVCQATGVLTQEIQITCGAQTHFAVLGENLPSGLRRGAERIGIINLGKGHADIIAAPARDPENEDTAKNLPIKVLSYEAKLPYAEIRMRLGAQKAVIAVTGKRCAISGVPYFLDTSLQGWRDKLRLAALGKEPLEAALHARAITDALSLSLAGKDQIREFQKFYPFGMSFDVMNAILTDMRQALKQTTLKTRTIMMILNVLLCAAFFYIFFMMGFERRLILERTPYFGATLDLVALVLTLMISWALLNFSTRFVLKRRFPQVSHALQQKIGKTGQFMLAGIILVYLLCLWLTPIKPALLALVRR